jgi:thymidylate kinase
MLIEITGVDGAGKSTLAERLRTAVTSAGLPCSPLTLRSMGKRLLDDVAVRRGAANWRQLVSPDEAEVAHAVEMVAQAHAALHPAGSGHVLVTETYVVRWLAVAAFWDAGKLDVLAAIYGRLPVPDVSVHLDLPAAEALRRITARPKGDRLLHGGGAERKLTRYAAAFDRVRPLLPYPQLVLSAARPVDDLVDEVAGLVPARRYAANR